MSPAMQQAFLQQIVPILTAVVPRSVTPVRTEDPAELVQDGVAMACEAVNALERAGKPVPLRSVAYYTVQRLRSGRRWGSAGRTDVMSPGCQLDGNSSVSSVNEPLQVSEEETDLTLGDLIACPRDDPAQVAIRNTDWGRFMAMLDAPQRYIVRATAEGESLTHQASRLQVSPSAVCQRRETIARRARAFWGDQVLADAAELPLWRKQSRRAW